MPQALILVPTRELALQVAKEAEILGADKGVRSVVVYGGVGTRSRSKG
jgi:ATP-dependent RNA helicase DeaD